MGNQKDVLRLRKETGLGMSKCYKALNQANGNLNKAMDILRKEGVRIAHKRLDRTMPEGATFIHINSEKTFAVILFIGCETDFVARNETFKKLGNAMVATAAAKQTQEKKDLLSTPYQTTTFHEELVQLAGRFGENIALTHYETLAGTYISSYLHSRKLGAIAALNMKKLPTEEIEGVARHIAMQAVVSNPLAIDESNIDPTIITKEKESITSQLKEQGEGKSPDIIERITQRKLDKFIKENILLTQPFVKNQKKTVSDILQAAAPNLAVTGFKRLEIKG